MFRKDNACQIFIDALLNYRDRGAYLLHAFVLMPDHFHVLLTPTANTSLEHAVKLVKGGSASRIRRELAYQFPVWQRGFSDHRIRDPNDCAMHLRYLEQNPVKKLLVAVPSDFLWSSACGRFPVDDLPQGLRPLSYSASLRHG